MRHESRLQSQSVLCVNAKCPELPMAHLTQLISYLGRHPVRITWRTGPFRFSGDTATLETCCTKYEASPGTAPAAYLGKSKHGPRPPLPPPSRLHIGRLKSAARSLASDSKPTFPLAPSTSDPRSDGRPIPDPRTHCVLSAHHAATTHKQATPLLVGPPGSHRFMKTLHSKF